MHSRAGQGPRLPTRVATPLGATPSCSDMHSEPQLQTCTPRRPTPAHPPCRAAAAGGARHASGLPTHGERGRVELGAPAPGPEVGAASAFGGRAGKGGCAYIAAPAVGTVEGGSACFGEGPVLAASTPHAHIKEAFNSKCASAGHGTACYYTWVRAEGLQTLAVLLLDPYQA